MPDPPPTSPVRCTCPRRVRACLESLFGQPVDGVRLVVRGPRRRWRATTRPNTIIVYGSCRGFFEDPALVLEEYYHVLEQWNRGRLSRIAYSLAYVRYGYDNPFEREAKAWVAAHLDAFITALAAAPAVLDA